MALQMLIVEARDSGAVAELQNAFRTELLPSLMKEPVIRSVSLAIEEGGQLAIVLLFWHSREAAFSFNQSARCTECKNALRPFIVGEFVVKFFDLHP